MFDATRASMMTAAMSMARNGYLDKQVKYGLIKFK
jgi:hypothetical protein